MLFTAKLVCGVFARALDARTIHREGERGRERPRVRERWFRTGVIKLYGFPSRATRRHTHTAYVAKVAKSAQEQSR